MDRAPHSLPDNARVVRALQLRVPDADEVPRARIALEDGLNCADFGDRGRLVFVRRLTLPAFAARFNGPAAARAIESSFRALLPEARPGADPLAAQAPVVWFDDEFAAHLEALTLRVEGRPLNAWFWRRVDPLFAGSVEPAIREVCERLETVAATAVSRPVFFTELARRWRGFSAAAFERFMAALPPAWVPDSNRPAGAPAGESTLIYRHRQAPRDVARAAAPRLAAAARISPAAARWVARWEAVAAGELRAEAPAGEVADFVTAVVREAEVVAAPNYRPGQAAEPHAAGHAPTTAIADRDSGPIVAVRDEVPVPEPTNYKLPPWFAGARETSHAGLFLLLNAWRATGADDWLCGGDEARRDAWLDDWARRLALPVDDAQRAAWSTPSASPDAAELAELARFRRETRRWLRTAARIGAASLVNRAGAVAMTRTHLDVIFPMNAVDLRVRRAGLDSDPGWVPWLGRIVAFHFVPDTGTDA
ncbi:MAG TPA: hypothetical protein VMF52_16485 [Steroidobacteraceae bacterium]|nr:hypothetical protein [Steroidobacteraceae bacterium]